MIQAPQRILGSYGDQACCGQRQHEEQGGGSHLAANV
jgi:hypothetical protein